MATRNCFGGWVEDGDEGERIEANRLKGWVLGEIGVEQERVLDGTVVGKSWEKSAVWQARQL